MEGLLLAVGMVVENLDRDRRPGSLGLRGLVACGARRTEIAALRVFAEV
jgi:hypothetical protein